MAEQPEPANIEFRSTYQPNYCTGEHEMRSPGSEAYLKVRCQRTRHGRGKHKFGALNPATGAITEILWTDGDGKP